MTQGEIRDKISLEIEPFFFPQTIDFKVMGVPIYDLPKDNEKRMSFQALFLFILRRYIPSRYTDLDHFLQGYPEFRERQPAEQERLRLTANWMDLAFHAITPKSNKTFLMNLIPRICEGRSARYITGSGETLATSDRVRIYRVEGGCEKIQRQSRKRNNQVLNQDLSSSFSLFSSGS